MSEDGNSIIDFFESIARMKANNPVDYGEIKKAFDPLNIIKAGEPCPRSSVEYFMKAWGVTVRRYRCDDAVLYDAYDWLRALAPNNADYFMRKFCEPNGFFMDRLAEDISPLYLGDERRWAGDSGGMSAIAIHLCSWRRLKHVDWLRIDQHASYLSHVLCVVTDAKYNPAVQQALDEFFDGQQLDIWEDAINNLPEDR